MEDNVSTAPVRAAVAVPVTPRAARLLDNVFRINASAAAAAAAVAPIMLNAILPSNA
jgi:hypothetical protein